MYIIMHNIDMINVFAFTHLFVGSLLLLTTVVPKGSAVIILAWLGTISCSAAFGAGYTYTKVSYI